MAPKGAVKRSATTTAVVDSPATPRSSKSAKPTPPGSPWISGGATPAVTPRSQEEFGSDRAEAVRVYDMALGDTSRTGQRCAFKQWRLLRGEEEGSQVLCSECSYERFYARGHASEDVGLVARQPVLVHQSSFDGLWSLFDGTPDRFTHA